MKGDTIMKKFAELNRNEGFDVNVEQQETSLVETKSFGTKVKEAGSRIIHNKWVKRGAAAVALGTVAIVGFALGSHKKKGDSEDELEIIDLDDEDFDELEPELDDEDIDELQQELEETE